jgi:protein SCO1/2
MNRSGWRWLLFVGLLLTFLGTVLVLRTLRNGPMPAGELRGIYEVSDDVPLPAFVLNGPKGEFTNADLKGHWSFIFFGYTQCPDICPTMLNVMKDVKAALAIKDAGVTAPAFQLIFVSVDPHRDTRELLDAYMAAFDPSFIGLRGDDVALISLTSKLGVFYQRNDGTDTQRYTVDHSAAVYLIDPRGQLRAVFSPPQEAPKLAADFRRITER